MSKRRKKVKKKNRKIVWIIESLLFIILISLLVLLKIFNPQEREKIEEKSEETVKPLVIQTQQRKLDLDQLHGDGYTKSRWNSCRKLMVSPRIVQAYNTIRYNPFHINHCIKQSIGNGIYAMTQLYQVATLLSSQQSFILWQMRYISSGDSATKCCYFANYIVHFTSY